MIEFVQVHRNVAEVNARFAAEIGAGYAAEKHFRQIREVSQKLTFE